MPLSLVQHAYICCVLEYKFSMNFIVFVTFYIFFNSKILNFHRYNEDFVPLFLLFTTCRHQMCDVQHVTSAPQSEVKGHESSILIK